MLTILRCGLAAALSLIAFPVAAEPPPTGYYGGFALPMISCMDKAQLIEIVAAGSRNHEDGAKARYDEFRKQGICNIGNPGVVAVGEVESLGTFFHSKGNQFQAWALHVGNPSREWWVMYLEVPDQPLPGEST